MAGLGCGFDEWVLVFVVYILSMYVVRYSFLVM